MARQPGVHDELVLIDQSQLGQRLRELHASDEQSLTRLLLELLNGTSQIPAHELRVPVDPVQGARHDILPCRVDRPGEGFHPSRPPYILRRRPPRCFHHFVGHAAEEEGIGLDEGLGRVTMQRFVRRYCTMIAAPVQCDVDGIAKGTHSVRVPLDRVANQITPSTRRPGALAPELTTTRCAAPHRSGCVCYAEWLTESSLLRLARGRQRA